MAAVLPRASGSSTWRSMCTHAARVHIRRYSNQPAAKPCVAVSSRCPSATSAAGVAHRYFGVSMRQTRRAAAALLACAVVAGSGLLVAAAAGVSSAAGATYYVAPGGSDSAAGTLSAPWASFAHAQSVAQAGDTVYFRGGTYTYTHGTRACTSETDRVD